MLRAACRMTPPFSRLVKAVGSLHKKEQLRNDCSEPGNYPAIMWRSCNFIIFFIFRPHNIFCFNNLKTSLEELFITILKWLRKPFGFAFFLSHSRSLELNPGPGDDSEIHPVFHPTIRQSQKPQRARVGLSVLFKPERLISCQAFEAASLEQSLSKNDLKVTLWVYV